MDNIYGQIGNFNRKMDTIKSQVKMLEIKTKTVTETRFNFGLLLDSKINEFKDALMKIIQI